MESTLEKNGYAAALQAKLNDQLADLVSVQLTRANSLLTEQIADRIRKLGIGTAASRVLALLNERNDQIVGDLVKNCCLKQPSVTRALEQLERKSLITRKRHPEDGRLVLAHITPSGRTLAHELLEIVLELEEKDLASYSREERSNLLHVLRDLIERLQGNKS